MCCLTLALVNVCHVSVAGLGSRQVYNSTSLRHRTRHHTPVNGTVKLQSSVRLRTHLHHVTPTYAYVRSLTILTLPVYLSGA